MLETIDPNIDRDMQSLSKMRKPASLSKKAKFN